MLILLCHQDEISLNVKLISAEREVHVGDIQIEQLHRAQGHSAQDFVGSHIVQKVQCSPHRIIFEMGYGKSPHLTAAQRPDAQQSPQAESKRGSGL
jgi:hypothetical protein